MTSVPERLLLLSVKPRHANAILDGTKTVELRRRPPQIESPTEALIYSSSPAMELAGSCWIDDIVAMAPWTLWRTYGPRCGVTRREFMNYFEGLDTAHGLVLSRARRFDDAVRLADIRVEHEGFQPPQSFRYVATHFCTSVQGVATVR